jgi:hypothetical protein
MRAAEKKPSQVFLFPSSFLQSLVCLHAFSEKLTKEHPPISTALKRKRSLLR